MAAALRRSLVAALAGALVGVLLVMAPLALAPRATALAAELESGEVEASTLGSRVRQKLRLGADSSLDESSRGARFWHNVYTPGWDPDYPCDPVCSKEEWCGSDAYMEPRKCADDSTGKCKCIARYAAGKLCTWDNQCSSLTCLFGVCWH